jgi:hypothetical protein
MGSTRTGPGNLATGISMISPLSIRYANHRTRQMHPAVGHSQIYADMICKHIVQYIVVMPVNNNDYPAHLAHDTTKRRHLAKILDEICHIVQMVAQHRLLLPCRPCPIRLLLTVSPLSATSAAAAEAAQ